MPYLIKRIVNSFLLLLLTISRSDLPLIQASIAVVAALVVMVNLFVDLSYRLINPRIKFGKKA